MSLVQVIGGQGAGGAADRTPFYGIKTPPEVKKLAQLCKTMDKAILKKILRVVVQYLESGGGEEEKLRALESAKCSQEVIRVAFAGMHTLLSAAVRLPGLKTEIFKEDLQHTKLPGEVIADLASVLSSSRRSKMDASVIDQRVRLPQIDGLRWRVDVTISNSSLHRVLEPSILMEMTLSDGSVQTFEVPVSKFHEMRYNVAYVLKEMEDLEKRNILKLKD